MLPSFRYHPDPLATESVVESDRKCVCCGQARGYIYYGPVDAEARLHERICPWCIADGSCHERFGAVFIDETGIGGDGLWDRVPREVVREVAYRTPAFCGWQQEMWWTHCGDAGQFLGFADQARLKELGPEAIAAIQEYSDQAGYLWEKIWKDLAHSVTAYMFRCTQCGKFGGYCDFT